jgi:effector-binding domain-containing protein
MEYVVEVKTVAEQLIVAARQRTTHKRVSQEIQGLLSRPWAFLKEHSDLRTDGHNVAIYWGEPGGGSIEVGVQVVAPFDKTDEVICSATPSGTVATTAHFGPYDQLGLAHDAVLRWCRQNGRQIRIPYWEVYGDWEEDPSKLRTDVFYLLK